MISYLISLIPVFLLPYLLMSCRIMSYPDFFLSFRIRNRTLSGSRADILLKCSEVEPGDRIRFKSIPGTGDVMGARSDVDGLVTSDPTSLPPTRNPSPNVSSERHDKKRSDLHTQTRSKLRGKNKDGPNSTLQTRSKPPLVLLAGIKARCCCSCFWSKHQATTIPTSFMVKTHGLGV